MEFPKNFQSRTQKMLGPEYLQFEESLLREPPVSIRINNKKSITNPVHLEIKQQVPWFQDGYYLSSRPSFTLDPLFHAGCYYVQEASSMFIGHMLQPYMRDKGQVILDICGAPGGKSTILLSLLSEDSILFSNEIIRSRSKILCENIIKWGYPDVVVTNNSSEDYKHSGLKFDIILCDAPCSGEGMFRKDPQSISEWSEANVKSCSNRQKEILNNVWHCLKPGGILLYSTCTYNTEEDESVARFIQNELGGTAIRHSIPAEYGIDTNNYLDDSIPVFHFFPHKTAGEGFFACLFKKALEEDDNPQKGKSGKYRQNNKFKPCPTELAEWVSFNAKNLFMTDDNGDIVVVNKSHSNLISIAEKKLNVIHKGVKVGNLKGKKYRPAHSLAMSVNVNRNAFPEIELSKDEALSYLRCESMILNNMPRGYILVNYLGHPLGFVNNLVTRANNMYPQEWRIRKQISNIR